MKRYILFLGLMAWITMCATAQQAPRMVLHLQSADTLVHKSVINQVTNLKKEFPDAELDVICHGPGLEFLKNNSVYARRIQHKGLTGITFTACEFTMSQRNVKHADLVPFARTVPHALAEIVRKQQNGWLYIKLGF
ncbi:MAG: hypothetical protein KatS3mg032_1878 [Cyclobacteriaceae bacterium]|nr:MAG: hypothetical protein KatS3mg032_1878 [Cyclobacteriaceae bacterium]